MPRVFSWRKHVGMREDSNKTNKLQRYTMVSIINALHVSGGSSAHHQELKAVYIASGICRAVIIQYNKLLVYKI